MIPPPGSGFPHAGAANEISVEKIPLEKCMGPAAVIDCRDLLGTAKPGMSPVITVDKVQNWEGQHGPLQGEDKVLLFTSWTELHYKRFPEGYRLEKSCNMDRETEGWPAPDEELIQYLAEKGVQHIGCDFPSLGQIQNDEGPHWAALENEMVTVEKLMNLSRLPPRGAYYMFFPLKIQNGTGSPGRAIAIL
jgi:kynurenine formamidase